MGVMDFSNFKEFVAFCESATPESWSNKDIARFNKRVYSLIRSDKEFSKNYQKFQSLMARKAIRQKLQQKRKILYLEQKRSSYHRSKTNKRLPLLQENICS